MFVVCFPSNFKQQYAIYVRSSQELWGIDRKLSTFRIRHLNTVNIKAVQTLKSQDSKIEQEEYTYINLKKDYSKNYASSI